MDPDYLYAEDLGGPGTIADVEIVGSGVGTVKNPGGKKELIWLEFKGKRKKLGLNATMAKTMTNLSGSSYWGDWRGWIRLVVIHKRMRDPTTDELEDMDVIRIAPERPAAREKLRAVREARGDTEAPISPDEQAEIDRIERQERE
jgi:hypothetical protein